MPPAAVGPPGDLLSQDKGNINFWDKLGDTMGTPITLARLIVLDDKKYEIGYTFLLLYKNESQIFWVQLVIPPPF